jgi:esterase
VTAPEKARPTEATPTSAQSVTVNGVRLHYDERGEGAPILCVHGAGSSAQLWADAVGKLARLGRAIAYDRRGYGRSERPEPCDRIDVAEHADDAAALLDSLGASPAVVIARSYGGEVATDLTLRYPEHVRALALLEAAPVELLPAATEWTRALRDRLCKVAAQAGMDAVGESLIGEVLGEGAWDSLPDDVRRIFTQNGPAALADLNGEWLNADAAALAALHQPVLLLAASDSPPEFREPNDVMTDALPNARSAVVGGGHLIDPADPVVLAFVEEVLESR